MFRSGGGTLGMKLDNDVGFVGKINVSIFEAAPCFYAHTNGTGGTFLKIPFFLRTFFLQNEKDPPTSGEPQSFVEFFRG